ncbi:MAG: hypothetical protein Q9221_005161 [Calogaya cf. arnoldii]
MTSHHVTGDPKPRPWEIKINKVLIALLAGAILNIIEKIIIQLIAMSFHLRTYSDGIDVNKPNIRILTILSSLDAILSFFVVAVTILIFLSFMTITVAESVLSFLVFLLALGWLLGASGQNVLGCLIFVLANHPYDVGDRVYIYGLTGKELKGDDYFVVKIALLYTEFRKMEGQVVRVPNSYLNTCSILNMRRSEGVAEAIPLTVKFGTTVDEIEDLRQRLVEFVKDQKRDFQPSILTEVREVVDCYSVNLNVILFYKSNWQNELLRLERRNKFVCALMIAMQDVGIEGPLMRLPGQKLESPYYVHYAGSAGPHPGTTEMGASRGSGGESISAMARRRDFSLGMSGVSTSGDSLGDLYADVSPHRVPLKERIERT